MVGFELYQTFLAFNLHFSKNSNYDYFKYHGKTRSKEETFLKSKFKWQFAALEKSIVQTQTIDQITLLYFLFKRHDFEFINITPKVFLELNTLLKAPKNLVIHDKILNDFKYLLTKYTDFVTILDTSIDSLYPNLYIEYNQKAIELETMLLFDAYILKFLVLETSTDIVAWPAKIKKFEKVQPFVMHLLPEAEFSNLVMEQLV